tara:strand:+ start:296 stop:559 length:264 start_codon:yes stop_codon:yes gene_type:complete
LLSFLFVIQRGNLHLILYIQKLFYFLPFVQGASDSAVFEHFVSDLQHALEPQSLEQHVRLNTPYVKTARNKNLNAKFNLSLISILFS